MHIIFLPFFLTTGLISNFIIRHSQPSPSEPNCAASVPFLTSPPHLTLETSVFPDSQGHFQESVLHTQDTLIRSSLEHVYSLFNQPPMSFLNSSEAHSSFLPPSISQQSYFVIRSVFSRTNQPEPNPTLTTHSLSKLEQIT